MAYLLHLHLPPRPGPPHPHHLGRHHKPTREHQTTPGEALRAIVPALQATNNRPRDGRARQRRHAHDGERHAHARARAAQVRRQAAQPRGEQRLQAAAEEPVGARPGPQPGLGRDGRPGQLADARRQHEGDEDVDGAEPVRQVVAHQPARDAHAAEREEEVERGRVREARDVAGKGGEVVKGKVQAEEALGRVRVLVLFFSPPFEFSLPCKKGGESMMIFCWNGERDRERENTP